MKKIIFVLAFMMAATICAEGHRHYIRPVTISVQTFYDDLSSYGEWISTPEYGYVWRPYLDDPGNFRPYATNGNWVYTDLGWTWVSGYPWGWATFHYGRWFYDDYLGWMWVPGNEWAPAWVAWGSYNNYWAWAPMGPNFVVNVNPGWLPPSFWWTFVPCNHFYSDNWYDYIYNQPVQVNNIICITNIYNYGDNGRHYGHEGWYHGPRVGDVERHLNTRVRRMEVVDTDKPNGRDTRNGRVAVYRPDVKADRKEDQPRNFRTVGTTRVNTIPVRRSERTVEPGVKRTGETGIATRSENRVIRNAGNPAPERKPSVNPGYGQRTERINQTGPVRIDHPSPSGGNIRNTGTRNENPSRRSDVSRQQPAGPGAISNQVKQQPAVPDRNRGQIERKNEAGNSRDVMTSSSRSSSSPAKRNK